MWKHQAWRRSWSDVIGTSLPHTDWCDSISEKAPILLKMCPFDGSYYATFWSTSAFAWHFPSGQFEFENELMLWLWSLLWQSHKGCESCGSLSPFVEAMKRYSSRVRRLSHGGSIIDWEWRCVRKACNRRDFPHPEEEVLLSEFENSV